MLLIIDFGGQTAHLIGRRLRQLGVKTEYADPDEAVSKINTLNPNGLILSGGPASVYEPNAPHVSKDIFKANIPILGICYGWQLMAKLLGGEVRSAAKEYGSEELVLENQTGIFSLPEKKCSVIMSHGDTVTKLPQGFTPVAHTRSVKFAAVTHSSNPWFGVQFHPEADHTEYGLELLRLFAQTVCQETLQPLVLNPEQIISDITAQVGNKKVICAVSGGVDSTVAAFLIGKAIGKNLIPVYVESGLMRPETDKRVRYIFTKLISANLTIVPARERFLRALKGIVDPEAQRKIIGKLYVDIFQETAAKHPEVSFLAQGTIYSDVIESKGSKHASRIKSHHNVGGLPKSLHLELLEPNRNYYKDEVREIGRLAGLPEEVIMQQPFPGPGFAVRTRGEVTEERLEQVKIADKIVLEEIKNAGLYDKLFQCFALMTGAYSTAVKGDARAFAEVVGVR